MGSFYFVALLTAAGASGAGGAPVVHAYHADQGGIFANAYLLETEKGLIAVDATLTVSDAKRLRAQADALKKPLLAVLLTHGHPDHYNGLTELVRGRESTPIYATAAVARVIKEWDQKKEAQWKPMFKEEWPAQRTFPNHEVRDGETVTAGGVRFTVHALGAGESHEDTYWIAEAGGAKYAFVGDLVFPGEHAYISDGHTRAWLANLERVRPALAGLTLYPGHGAPGGVEMLAEQARYLEKLRAEVARLAAGKAKLGDAEKEELVKVMSAYRPSAKLTFLLTAGADAVAAEPR